MTSRAILLLLMYHMLLFSVAALASEPLQLGSGHSDKVINLDAGAGHSGQSYGFGRSGFVAPAVSQPEIVSPNVMVTQAEGLLNEALAARDQVVRIYNETLAAKDGVEECEGRVKDLEQQAQYSARYASDSAEKALESARNASDYAARAAEIRNITEAASEKVTVISLSIEGAQKDIRSQANETRAFSDASAANAARAMAYLNEIQTLYNETAALYNETAALYKETAALYNEKAALHNETVALFNEMLWAYGNSSYANASYANANTMLASSG
jgi:chromosome segregation ATPase